MTAPKRKKRAGGRPRAFDDKKRAKAVQLTKKGLSLNGIAKILRVNRTTLDDELKRNDDFREEMLAADGDGEMWCLDRWRKCMEGKGTTSQLNAIVKYMARKWPDDYALSKKLEGNGKSVTVNIQNNNVHLGTPEQRADSLEARLVAEAQRRGLTLDGTVIGDGSGSGAGDD